jgi:hypothetical protein
MNQSGHAAQDPTVRITQVHTPLEVFTSQAALGEFIGLLH